MFFSLLRFTKDASSYADFAEVGLFVYTEVGRWCPSTGWRNRFTVATGLSLTLRFLAGPDLGNRRSRNTQLGPFPVSAPHRHQTGNSLCN